MLIAGTERATEPEPVDLAPSRQPQNGRFWSASPTQPPRTSVENILGKATEGIIGQTVQRVISTGNEQVAVQNQTGKRSATDARKRWNAAAATLSLLDQALAELNFGYASMRISVSPLYYSR